MATGGTDFTTCSICLGPFDTPRMLPCGHSFCIDCLQSLITRGDRNCPDCRKVFPNQSAHKFPINYAVMSVKSISIFDSYLSGFET